MYLMAKSDEFFVPRLQFKAEQDGPAEQELKRRLIPLFGAQRNILRAYLARVGYGNSEVSSVALCLVPKTGIVLGMEEKVAKVFSSAFAKGQHLDIIFLTHAQEFELVKLCRPFYSVAS